VGVHIEDEPELAGDCFGKDGGEFSSFDFFFPPQSADFLGTRTYFFLFCDGEHGECHADVATTLPRRLSLFSSLSFRPRRLWLCRASVHFIFILDRGRDLGLASPGGGCWVPCASVAAVVRCLEGFRG
jgi:hypothetical protein